MSATILIVNGDRAVPESSGRWKDGQILLVNDVPYTTGGEADVNSFVQFTITDKTPEEVDAKFFAPWNMKIAMTTANGPDPSGFRRLWVRNENTNSSGTKGGWNAEMTDSIELEWNARYPECNLTTLRYFQGINPGDTWECEGTFTSGQATEFEQVVTQKGSEVLDYRRIWYVNQTGMDNIRANGGIQQGTASQLGNWVEDYRVTT